MPWSLHVDGNQYAAYRDVWSPDLGNQRWYRRLEADGTYLYRTENLQTGIAGLFGSAQDTGAPAQIIGGPFQVQVRTSDDALGYFDVLLTLIRDLAGRLVNAANHQVAIQGPARHRADAVNQSLADADAARNNAAAATDDVNRTRLIRLGIRHALDAAASTRQWAQPLGLGLGPYHAPIVGVATRAETIATQLYGHLQ
jgi:hypothetical protein